MKCEKCGKDITKKGVLYYSATIRILCKECAKRNADDQKFWEKMTRIKKKMLNEGKSIEKYFEFRDEQIAKKKKAEEK